MSGAWALPDEDGEQAIIAKLTEVCTDAEGMLLAQALDKAARQRRASTKALDFFTGYNPLTE
jgi:hypothetical protein